MLYGLREAYSCFLLCEKQLQDSSLYWSPSSSNSILLPLTVTPSCNFEPLFQTSQ